jgi:hypothetical protein
MLLSDDEEVTRLDMLLIERVEHRPAGRVCGECRFLGAPVRVTERSGARRLRRACSAGGRGHTDPDWPACERFEGVQVSGVGCWDRLVQLEHPIPTP